MFKTTRTLINALTEKKAIKNNLELYDLSGNNPIPLDPETEEKKKMQKLVVANRLNNIKVYSRNMAEIIGKRALLTTPIILGGITIASFVNGNYIKTVTTEKAYKTTTIEFDEESLLSQDENLYAHACFNMNFVDDSIQACSHDENMYNSSYATFYYGEGSDSLQVKFNINADNTWTYSSHTNNLYQKDETNVKESIGDLDEEYKQLIKEATETFIKQAELTDEEEALLREIVSNNENDILVKINRCVDLSGMELEVRKYHWIRCLLASVAEIVLIYLIVYKIDDILSVRDAEANGPYLRYCSSYINLLESAKKYREEFQIAEIKRLTSILDLLKEHAFDKATIKEYEKRLSLYKKETLSLPEDL